MSQRSGNRPIRRIARADTFDAAELKSLAKRMVYVGSAHHKRSPGGYHGYRLEDEDDMCSLVLKEWKKRGEPAEV